MNQNVSVSIAFKYPAEESAVNLIPGGIRVEVGGIEVTKQVDQEVYNNDATEEESNKTWWYDHTGQPLNADPLDYKGGFSIYFTLMTLSKNIREIARRSPDRFDQLTSEVGDSPYYLVLSYLDGEHDLIRIAYQGIQGRVGNHRDPPVESAVGYAVPLTDLCTEVARCLTEFVTYADAHALNAQTTDQCDTFTEIAAELEQFAAGDGLQSG